MAERLAWRSFVVDEPMGLEIECWGISHMMRHANFLLLVVNQP